MKNIFTTGLLAIALLALSQQQVSAWVNTRFGVGINWERQTGGNNFGWGAWVNGQPPGPDSMPSYPSSTHHSAAATPGYAPAPYAMPSPQGSFDLPSAFESPYANSNVQYGSPYQFATYPRPTYYYYATPSYYYGR